VKMRAVAGARRPVVVVNAAEGEPLSTKDRELCRAAPHLVLDGAELAAAAIGARRVVVAVRGDALVATASLRAAIAERRDGPVEIATVPAAYLAGEETALIRFLGGGPLLPTGTPPLPSQRGLRGRPTLVQNVETLAHVALIARHGASWFKRAGTPADPGTALVTVSGAVRRPGLHEIAMGASLPELLEQAGGTSGRPRAVLLGGFHGSWVHGAEVADLALDEGSLTPYGASLAAGVVFVLGEHACPVREVATVLRWLAAESAGQCGPCRSGLPAIAAELTRVADGGGRIGLLRRWCRQLPGRGACRLPDGAVRFLVSALDLFDAELADHAQYGPCETCARPREILPPSDAGRAAA